MIYKTPPVLKGLEFESARIDDIRTKQKLLLIDLHMSNVCNLRCPGCYRNAGRVLSEELTIGECKMILRQAQELGARTWVVTGSGEPFLDPKLLPLIEFANSLGLSAVVFTNNTLITPELASWISDRDLAIVAKLNSFDPAVQDFIAGVRGAHVRIFAGLENLIKAGLNRQGRLGIDSVIVQQNYQAIPQIFRFCRDNSIIPYITTELHGGRGAVNADRLDINTAQIRRIFFHLLDVDRRQYGYDWDPHPPIIAQGSCSKILYQLFVGPTGEIGLCPGLIQSANLGNIRKVSLRRALSSVLVDKIRHPEIFFQTCPICFAKKNRCTGGCLLSKQDAGDLFGLDPQCQW